MEDLHLHLHHVRNLPRKEISSIEFIVQREDLLSNASMYHLDHDLEQYDQPMKQNESDVLEED